MKVGKVLAIVGVGCLVLVVAAVVALVAGVRWLGTDPPDIVVRVEAPVQVPEGRDFEVKASVKNESGRPRTLVDVDIADAYLAGIAVRAATPPFKKSTHVPIDDTISHSFDLVLPPHGDTTITFGMSAVHTGDFAGDFEPSDLSTRCAARSPDRGGRLGGRGSCSPRAPSPRGGAPRCRK